ncbi:PKD domain-containing protein [Mucilaginibacter sp. HD30]
MKKTLFSIGIVLRCALGFSQAPVSVNLNTGTSSVVVPIDNIQAGDVTVPVSLAYGSNGVKLKYGEGTAGLGWNLIAGGQITREVRGLPDDYGGLGGELQGWLYSSKGAAIDGFAIANNSNPPNCTDQTTDLSYISSHFNDYDDTEPDLFSVRAPGLSCNFVFDSNNQIRLAPYQDLKIEYDISTTFLGSFTVTNNRGTKYHFTLGNLASMVTSTRWDIGMPYWPEANIKYFKKQYYQYLNLVGYYDAWLLTSITDASGNTVSFNYTNKGASSTRDLVAANSGGTGLDSMYAVFNESDVNVLSNISAKGDTVNFSYNTQTNDIVQGTLLSSISSKGIKYAFNYATVNFNKDSVSFEFNCLRSITAEECASPLNYRFVYEGESGIKGPYVYSNRDSVFQYTDAWGYYTGKKSNNVGTTNAAMTNIAMLKQIKYFNSGTTDFEYESNSYKDPNLGTVIYGGGVRIKKITDFDGISATNNIVRNYGYADSLGVSTGVPLALPQYKFIRPVASSPTTGNSTVTVISDQSENDQTIMYAQVKQSQTNNGYTISDYSIPAGAFAATVPLGDWTPTISHAAVPGCTPSLGLLENTVRTYPFAPNANYEFEQGLLKRERSYNEAGSKVAESNYTYTRSNASATPVYALRLDENDYAKVYAKYAILTNTSELVAQIDSKVFDPSVTAGISELTKFYYSSTAHHLVTEEEKTGSDGSVSRTHISYTRDYAGGTASAYSTALVAKNINIPLETYNEIKPSGSGTFRVTGGQVTKFASFTSKDALVPNILPSQVYKLISPAGLTDFVPTITTNAATPDSRYVLANTLTSYDKLGMLKSGVGINRRPQTVLSDTVRQVPLAVFNNAAPTEVAYALSSNVTENFVPSTPANIATVAGRWDGQAADSFTGNVTFTRAITKNTWVKYYIFSAWIKSASGGSFNVNAIAASTVSATLTYDNSNIWKYYEVKLPVSMLADNFTVSFTVTNSLVIGHDVLCYPQTTEVSTSGYDANFNYALVETGTNGNTAYYQKDKFGRVHLAFDKDKQITLRKTYDFKNPSVTLPYPLFAPNEPVGHKDYYVNEAYTFYIANNYADCDLPMPTFSWNYGDGSSPTSSNVHTWTTPGTYTVTLTTTATGYAPQSSTYEITIKTPPPPMVALYYINNTSSSGLKRLEFLQGGVVVKRVEAGNIGFTTIPQGSYTVKVYCYGEDTDISVVAETDSTAAECKNWLHANVYTYNVDTMSYFMVILNPTPCE